MYYLNENKNIDGYTYNNRISSDECSPITPSVSDSCLQLYVACDWLRTAAEPSYAWPSRVIQQSAEHSTRD